MMKLTKMILVMGSLMAMLGAGSAFATGTEDCKFADYRSAECR